MNIFNIFHSLGLIDNAEVSKGRYTAVHEKPFVVFLVGMRINRLLSIHKWLPVLMAMIPMLTDLIKNKEKGLMGRQTWFSWREVMVVQYWNSYDQLESFARSINDPHYKPWKNYNKSVSSSGTVGIWHETYLIDPKDYECIHVNMPLRGLLKATKQVPLQPSSTSKSRLGELVKKN
jgi:hypothetical protein